MKHFHNVMAAASNITPTRSSVDAGRFVADLEAVLPGMSDNDFTLGSEKIKSLVSDALANQNARTLDSTEVGLIEREILGLSSYADHRLRWINVFDIVKSNEEVNAKQADDENSENDGEEPEAEPEPDPSAEGDEEKEEDATAGLVNRLTVEFSAKDSVDQFLLDRLPSIPIIGWPFKLIILIYRFACFLWESFIAGVDWLAKRLNTEENVVSGLRIASDWWKPLAWFIVFITTVLAYSHWIWYIVIWPFLRWLSDPFGRTFRTIQNRLKGNDDQPSEEPVEPSN